tara:strand:+ start:399 stop:1361 length:963 start_codon:yes stop_codon:yes gene_type:complete
MKNFFLIIFSILFTFTTIELYLYIEDYHPEYKRYNFLINDTLNIVNDDPNDFFKDKKQNKTVFLGDSFTVNQVCAHNKKDFVNIIKSKFTDKKNSYYNFGSLADSPPEYINIAEHISKNVQNIIVVLYYNDIFLGKKSCNSILKNPQININSFKGCTLILNENIDKSEDTIPKKIDNFFENKIKTWKLLKTATINIPQLSKLYSRTSWRNLYRDNKSEENIIFISLLKQLKNIAKENDINLKITYFPDINNITRENEYAKDWRFFIKNAEKNNIKIYDPWDYFLKNSDGKNMVWSLTDDHPNCKANKIMADYLINYVLFN